MNETKDIKKENNLMDNVCPKDCNVCFSSYTCSTCYYFDGSYHGGFCDKYRVDTAPDGSCGDWSSR